MSIAITGASGALGRATADALLDVLDPRDVVLATRRPDGLDALSARGVAVRGVDFSDEATLAGAFDGVERLLLISTDAVGRRLDGHRAAIAAARASGVHHVVYTSFPQPVPQNPAAVVADHAGTEQALRSSGMAWTVLRNNVYAHTQVGSLAHAAASGRLRTNFGSGATAYVSRDDCAAAAAAVLAHGGHEGRAYDITGPQALSAVDLASLAGELHGRDVRAVEVDDRSFHAGLRAAGLPDEVAGLVTSLGAATRGGFLGEVSTAVADLTGRAPTPLEQVARASRS